MVQSKFIVRYKRTPTVNRLNLSIILGEVKTRMANEKDPYKKQCWAEIGVELNSVFLKLMA